MKNKENCFSKSYFSSLLLLSGEIFRFQPRPTPERIVLAPGLVMSVEDRLEVIGLGDFKLIGGFRMVRGTSG